MVVRRVNLNQQDKVAVAEALQLLAQMVETDNLLLQVTAEPVQQLTYQVHQ
jgi:hypothetical protein